MGWADVGYHSDHILTPNIDSLAADGVLLNHFYAHTVCSPSRGALLTAVHPIHLGFQNSIIHNKSPYGLPLDRKIWPQYLKQRYNYSTHIVGKWHQGFARKEYTPTYRGFDSHVGFWTMGIGYYDHRNCFKGDECGLDFRHNMDMITNASDIYSTHYFTDRCLNIIGLFAIKNDNIVPFIIYYFSDQHNTSQPLFLYVPYQAVQASLVPIRDRLDLFPYIRSPERRELAAIAYSMDESIGTAMEALHSKHMLDNSIVIFFSDNGGHPVENSNRAPGPTNGPKENGAQNRPLRGGKYLFYEGGIRVPALVWSPLLNKSGYVSQALVHISDLLPTVLDAIDGTAIDDQAHIYGVSQWKVLSNNERPVRWEIQHNVDPITNTSAIRWYDWKLIKTSKHYGPSFADYTPSPIDIGPHLRTNIQNNDRLNSKTYRILRQMNRRPDYNVL
ncbi:unnamed protein product, partial [Medioppia subpectinata]